MSTGMGIQLHAWDFCDPVQDLALGPINPHEIGLNPLVQSVQVLLQSFHALRQITPSELCVICKFSEGARPTVAFFVLHPSACLDYVCLDYAAATC